MSPGRCCFTSQRVSERGRAADTTAHLIDRYTRVCGLVQLYLLTIGHCVAATAMRRRQQPVRRDELATRAGAATSSLLNDFSQNSSCTVWSNGSCFSITVSSHIVYDMALSVIIPDQDRGYPPLFPSAASCRCPGLDPIFIVVNKMGGHSTEPFTPAPADSTTAQAARIPLGSVSTRGQNRPAITAPSDSIIAHMY